MKTKKILPMLIIAAIILAGCLSIGGLLTKSQSYATETYDQTYYVSEYGSDATGDGSHDNPWATLARTAEAINGETGYSYLVYVMSDLTSTACARYYDNNVTITSLGDTPFTVTRGTPFAEINDTYRSYYNPAMLEINARLPTPAPTSLTLSNITFDDAYKYEGSTFSYANNTNGQTCVQDGIIASYAGVCTIILDDGATLENFGGMTAIRAAGANVIMNSGSLITDVGANANTTRTNSTGITDWTGHGEAAVSVNYGSFFMYNGAQITNIANATAVKLMGTYKCFIDGEIANMIGNKGYTPDLGSDGRGMKNAVQFNGTTLSPGYYDSNTGVLDLTSASDPGSAIIGKNANIHNNLTKSGTVAVNRSTGISVEIYGKINNNTGGTGSTLSLAGTNGGGLYIVAGGTIILEDPCEIIGNKVVGGSYGGAASVQQYNSKLIMNGGTISGNTASVANTGGIVVSKTSNAFPNTTSFVMNGGTIDNGPYGVILYESGSDGTNGTVALNGGLASVIVGGTVAYGNSNGRFLYLDNNAQLMGAGYASVAGRQVTPISADFNIGNPNMANYASIRSALQGWTMPADSNVVAFWMQKTSGTAVFSVPTPTTGYSSTINVYFVAVQGTLANGAVNAASPVKILPTTRDGSGNVVVSVPLDAYMYGATVALVQPSDDYGTIDFEGPSELPYDYNATSYTIPYTASYDMPPAFHTLLMSNGDDAANTDVMLYIMPDLRTILDPATLTIDSDIFDLNGAPTWDPIMGEWAIPLVLKTGWDNPSDLTTSFAFDCSMDPQYYQDGGVLTLTGQMIITETGAGGSTYVIYGDQADTDMVIPTYTVAYDGNNADSGNPPSDPNSYAQGEGVTVLGNIGIAGDGTDVLVKDGYTFLGWSENRASTTAEYGSGGTFDMPDHNMTLYAIWGSNNNGGGTAGYCYITATADTGSSISPSGTVTVPYGENKTFTFSAKSGYYISAVYVDGAAIPSADLASGKYTFMNIISNHTIRVESGASPPSDNTGDKTYGGDNDKGNSSWAVLNLICAILAIFAGLISVIAGKGRFRSDDEEKRSKAAVTLRVLALIIGIVSVIVFFITEDWTLPVVAIDKWTLLMFILFLATLIIMMISFRFDVKREKES